ncbi:diphthine--ammonia ligase [Fodinibius halophilus]|uniref:Diphthine--ammonia ligase n=1 Tax=Fodinibius halophilus TaxID=1736908 RepID=A0A6M1SYY6_9BACT|nr:diphthine--ammonia ligase [Fodinibius halophilus]NGP86849.1 diphthine--ammonia ligase [Fodinibius halophilus]
MKKALFNWSGGKDSSFALYRVLQDDAYEISGLLTSFNKSNQRVSMHGIHQGLIEEQARQIGLPLHKLMLPENLGMEAYNTYMEQELSEHKEKGICTGIFGDIFLEDLKEYREEQLKKIGLNAEFPLWKESTSALSKAFIEVGFKAVVVSVSGQKLGESFVGRLYDESFIEDLPQGVDPCGENGEFHTFVFDGPIFEAPVSFNIGETVERTYDLPDNDDSHSFRDDSDQPAQCLYWFLDLEI